MSSEHSFNDSALGIVASTMYFGKPGFVFWNEAAPK